MAIRSEAGFPPVFRSRALQANHSASVDPSPFGLSGKHAEIVNPKTLKLNNKAETGRNPKPPQPQTPYPKPNISETMEKPLKTPDIVYRAETLNPRSPGAFWTYNAKYGGLGFRAF